MCVVGKRGGECDLQMCVCVCVCGREERRGV